MSLDADHGRWPRLHTLAIIVVATACGCGRIGFDPLAERADGGQDIDAPAAQACDRAIDVQVGTPLVMSTCTGVDELDGCGPPSTEEVLFRFVAPESRSYWVGAYDGGGSPFTNGTDHLDASCSRALTCIGLSGRQYTAGEVAYFAVEAGEGGCAEISFEIEPM